MKSYLKFLSRNKLYTTIEAVGLAVSLAFVILIGSYVVQHYQVAHESPDWKRTFVLGSDEFLGLTYWDKEELEMNIPEVEVATHVALMWQPIVRNGEQLLQSSGMEADADFFKVFPQYRLVEGNLDDFVGKDDILISESLARTVTPGSTGSLIGSILNVNNSDKTIKGIFADFEDAFFMPCDIIANIENSWGASQTEYKFNSIGSYPTWYLLRDDADQDNVETKIKALLHKNYDSVWHTEKVEKWHPYRMDEAFFSGTYNGINRGGDLQMLRLLTVVVLLLLLSAIFNYVNLSLALTGKRSKEMATRRLLGADKTSILWKHIGESIAFTAVCFAAALVLAWSLAPMVNNLVSSSDPSLVASGLGDTSVKLSFLMTPGYIAAYVLGVLLLGTICGLLPALAASRFEPIDIIKGTLRRRSKMVLSKVFIVVQNVLAVFLISMALVMEAQMRHMLTRPMHSAVDNLYCIEYNAGDYNKSKLLIDKLEALPFVTQVGMGRGIPGHINNTMGIKTDETRHVTMPVIVGDTTYFRLLDLEIQEDFGHPLAHSIWMSESAFNAAGVSDTSTVFPRKIMFNNARADYIGGILHDFPTGAASQGETNPNGAIIVTRTEELYYANCLLIGTIGEDKSYDETIRNAYREYQLEQNGVEDPAWNYGFVRDLNHKQLGPERRTLRLVELFAVLSVLIALLGLLAMSTYFADENTKQIAIRKVFGADVNSETKRNVRSYIILVGIACVIGIPLAVWAARVYLRRFAYRVEDYGWVFIVAVIISLAIAFGTVLWQTLKAAKTNPAEELKKE